MTFCSEADNEFSYENGFISIFETDSDFSIAFLTSAREQELTLALELALSLSMELAMTSAQELVVMTKGKKHFYVQLRNWL